MSTKLRTAIRSLLVFFPFSQDIKPVFQRTILNALKVPFEDEFRALKHFPDIENAHYLDIGGNQGFAVDAIKMLKKNAVISSFEPNPLLADSLTKRYKNNSQINILAYGLGNEEGNFSLYIPVYNNFVFYGLASFDRQSAESWLKNNELYFYDEARLEIREYVCKVIKLDSLNLEPFFLKIDVQGYELDVLLGGKETICRHRPIILMESVSEEHMGFLAQFGYRLYRYDHQQRKFFADEKGDINSFLMTEEKYQTLLN